MVCVFWMHWQHQDLGLFGIIRRLYPNNVHSVTINDLDKAAIDLARQNVKYNNLESSLVAGSDTKEEEVQEKDTIHEEIKNGGIRLVWDDATHLMYSSRRPSHTPHPPSSSSSPQDKYQSPQYDVIDLDPYGSASIFLDSAIQAITNGGMLCVTCTDMVALGGSSPSVCYGRYDGSMPLPHAPFLHEMAVSILLYSLAMRAACYGKVIRPILSVGMHFYVRVFVEVWEDKSQIKDLSLNIGTVYQSSQCPSFHVIPHGQHGKKNKNVLQTTRAPAYPTCQETDAAFKTAGPIWLGPLHDVDVLNEAIERLEPLLKQQQQQMESLLMILLLRPLLRLHLLLLHLLNLKTLKHSRRFMDY